MAKRIALYALLAVVAIAGITSAPPVTIAVLVFFAFKIYEFAYFRSDKFMAIKDRISAHIQDCNDLNDHIEELKSSHIGTNMLDRGHSDYHDKSKWNYKRSGFRKITNAPNVYNCTRTVEYLTCWGPGLLRLGAIMSFGGYCVSRPGLLRLGAVVG